ncbi:MAG: hypothetical protein AB2A00_06820 [Myxococcota bacterium]
MPTEPSEKDLQLAQDILNIFDQQDESGEYLFPDEEVRHVLPLLILGSGLKPDECSPAVQEVLGEFAQLAGLDMKASADEISAQVKAFYEEYPPDETLLGGLQALLRENAAGMQELANKAAQRVTGREESNVPLSARKPEKGAVKGGALARMNVDGAMKKKDAKKK